jgi:predicted DNA-binding transcriptional regulator AlpA
VKDVAVVIGSDGGQFAKPRDPASPPQGATRHKIPPTPPPADPPLMTRHDVAAMLRTTPRQISNMAARGQLPASIRVAGLGVRWRRTEIDAWIAAK